MALEKKKRGNRSPKHFYVAAATVSSVLRFDWSNARVDDRWRDPAWIRIGPRMGEHAVCSFVRSFVNEKREANCNFYSLTIRLVPKKLNCSRGTGRERVTRSYRVNAFTNLSKASSGNCSCCCSFLPSLLRLDGNYSVAYLERYFVNFSWYNTNFASLEISQ